MQPNEISKLLQQLTANRLTGEEREKVTALLQNEDQREKVIELLQQWMTEEETTSPFDEQRWIPILQKVLDTDRHDHAPTLIPARKPMYMGWRAVAALLILAVGTTVVLMVTRRTQHASPIAGGDHPAVSDAVPGTNKAVLTLGNGSQIILDDAHNGALVEQGSMQIVKTDSGSIAYRALNENSLNTAGTRNRGANATEAAVPENILATPRGGQYQLSLPDGTQVWLNAASSIRYPASFTGAERMVRITGEVYFEIAKNSRLPFRVKVNDLEVEVLGTHFNINAYNDEPAISTTLLEGRVKVMNTIGKEAVVLSRGQEARVSQPNTASQDPNLRNRATGQAPIRVIQAADTAQVMAWKNGVFQFKEADLPTVMRQLARWYDLDVVYEGKIPTDRFNGKIPRDAMAAQVLSTLEKNQVHFRIEGKKLIVTP